MESWSENVIEKEKEQNHNSKVWRVNESYTNLLLLQTSSFGTPKLRLNMV